MSTGVFFPGEGGRDSRLCMDCFEETDHQRGLYVLPDGIFIVSRCTRCHRISEDTSVLGKQFDLLARIAEHLGLRVES
jgi:hypothetical protein